MTTKYNSSKKHYCNNPSNKSTIPLCSTGQGFFFWPIQYFLLPLPLSSISPHFKGKGHIFLSFLPALKISISAFSLAQLLPTHPCSVSLQLSFLATNSEINFPSYTDSYQCPKPSLLLCLRRAASSPGSSTQLPAAAAVPFHAAQALFCNSTNPR